MSYRLSSVFKVTEWGRSGGGIGLGGLIGGFCRFFRELVFNSFF